MKKYVKPDIEMKYIDSDRVMSNVSEVELDASKLDALN